MFFFKKKQDIYIYILMILHIEGLDCNLSIIQIFVESFLLVVTGHLPKRSAACQVVPRLQPNEGLTVGWNHSSKFFLWKWIILSLYWFSEILPPPVTRLYMKRKPMNCVLDSRNSYISSISFVDFPWPISPMATPKLSGMCWIQLKQPTEDVLDGHQVGSSSNGH